MIVNVTDHALIRWLTRVHGIDMEDFRQMLAETAEPYAAIGVKHACVDGFWFIFDGGKLVTVQENRPNQGQMLRNDKGNVNHTRNEPVAPMTPREMNRMKARRGRR